jgi:hypothetical protein
MTRGLYTPPIKFTFPFYSRVNQNIFDVIIDLLVKIVKEAKVFKRNEGLMQDKILSALMHF